MIVDKIYLSWRKGKGHGRFIIGEIYRYHSMYGYNFRYIKQGVFDATREGFINYPEFPNTHHLDYVYSEGIKQIFSLRLIPEGRIDRSKYLSFWLADKQEYDWFDQLALTQGSLPTDNFEFLGVYNPPKVQRFVTDIAHIAAYEIPKGIIKIGDELTYVIEDNDKDFSGKAVKVFHLGKEIGYIKTIHNLFIVEAIKKMLSPMIRVIAIDQNGKINRLFVSVFI